MCLQESYFDLSRSCCVFWNIHKQMFYNPSSTNTFLCLDIDTGFGLLRTLTGHRYSILKYGQMPYMSIHSV